MRRLLITICALILCVSAWGAQPEPKDVAFAELMQHPETYNGQLVRVRGVCTFGWEGDNFLLDPATPPTARSGALPHLWMSPYGKSHALGSLFEAGYGRRSHATLTGYFRIIRPNTRALTFDPGPYSIEVISANDIGDNRLPAWPVLPEKEWLGPRDPRTPTW